MQEGAKLPPKLGTRPARSASSCSVAALALLGVGAFAALDIGLALILLGVGTLVLFVGVVDARPPRRRPLAALVGAPARRAGGAAGQLARRERGAQPGADGEHRRRADDRRSRS